MARSNLTMLCPDPEILYTSTVGPKPMGGPLLYKQKASAYPVRGGRELHMLKICSRCTRDGEVGKGRGRPRHIDTPGLTRGYVTRSNLEHAICRGL